MQKHTRYLGPVCGLFLIFLMFPNLAWSAPGKGLITADVIKEIKAFLDVDIVSLAIENQNKKYNNLPESKILELDNQWRAETKSEDQPLISVILSNPLSSYLTRIQAHSVGLYPEIFIMDKNGLNVGQSNISSDFWQGDEDKFQKTYGVGAGAIFIDEPEYNDETKIWSLQVNFAISDKAQQMIGAATVEVNLTELERRSLVNTQPLEN